MGLLLLWKGGGISSRIALRHLSHPRLHVQSAKDHTGEETALQSVGPRAQTLKVIRTHDSPVVLTQVPILITPEEPWVLVTVRGQSVDLLWDARAMFCSLKFQVCFPPDPPQ